MPSTREPDLQTVADHFAWQAAPWGQVLVCRPLLAIAPHLFTTRHLPGGEPGGARVAYRALGRHLDVDPSGVRDMQQVHGATVFHVSAEPDRPEADALITARADVAIVVRTADCVPVLMADRSGRTVAAVHAGWRGTCAGAVMAAVRDLESILNVRPGDLVAAVGPSIGPCCYQVGRLTRDAFDRAVGLPDHDAWFRPSGDGWRLDLWKATRDQLIAVGLPESAIFVVEECTASHLDRYFSYRAESDRAGRLFAAIRRAPRV